MNVFDVFGVEFQAVGEDKVLAVWDAIADVTDAKGGDVVKNAQRVSDALKGVFGGKNIELEAWKDKLDRAVASLVSAKTASQALEATKGLQGALAAKPQSAQPEIMQSMTFVEEVFSKVVDKARSIGEAFRSLTIPALNDVFHFEQIKEVAAAVGVVAKAAFVNASAAAQIVGSLIEKTFGAAVAAGQRALSILQASLSRPMGLVAAGAEKATGAAAAPALSVALIVSGIAGQMPQVATAFTQPLANMATSVGGMARNISSAVATPMTSMINSLGAVVGSAVKPFTELGFAIHSFVNPIARIVDLIDPAIVEIINQEIENLMATIGEALMPILEAVLPIIRRLGDFIANIDFAAFIDPLVSFMNTLAEAFFSVLEAMKPFLDMMLNVFGQVIKALEPIIPPLADALMAVLEAVMPVVEAILQFLMPLLDALVPVLVQVAKLIGTIARAFVPLINVLLDALKPLMNTLVVVVNALCSALVPLIELLGKPIQMALQGTASAIEGFQAGIAGAAGFGPDALAQKLAKEADAQAKAEEARAKDKKTRATAKRGVEFFGVEEASKRAIQAAGNIGVKSDAMRAADAAEGAGRGIAEIVNMLRGGNWRNPFDGQRANDAERRRNAPDDEEED